MKLLSKSNFLFSIILITTAVLLSSCDADNVSTVNLTQSVQSKPITIAHRGYSGEFPENTLQAFEGAMNNGFDGIECDVWENIDGDMLVHHDTTTTRMTGKSEYIWNVKLSERDKFPIVSGANIDKYEKNSVIIPTLSETLKEVAKDKGYFFLHIKTSMGREITEQGAKKIIRLLDRYAIKNKTLIIGRKNGLKPFLKSGYDIALNISPKNKAEFESETKWCKENGVKILSVIKMEQLKVLGSRKKFAVYCERNGLEFGVYTTKTRGDFKKLTELGAKFAMSDNIIF